MGNQNEGKKSGKLAWLMMFVGILLLLAGISLGNSMVMKLKELNGENSLNKVVVSVKNQLDSLGLNSFTLLNMKDLSHNLKTVDIAFNTNTVSGSIQAANSGAAAQAEIVGTNSRYPEFTQLSLKFGSFFTDRAEMDGEAAAIIEDTLAWTLFKTQDAVGRKLKILGTAFKIVGVIEKGDSIIETLTDDGIPDVYIPAERLLELDTTAGIACFQVRTEEAGLSGQHEAAVTSALQSIGKNPANYQINNYQMKDLLLSQIPLIIQIIPGLISIVILIGFFLKKAKASYNFIKMECSDKDLGAAFKENLLHIGKNIFMLLFLAAGVCGIWLLISFKPYIPSEYIPDELINFAYYTNLIRSSIGNRISEMGYISPQIELIMNMGEILTVPATIIPAIVSLILIRSGFVRLRHLDVQPIKLTLLSALMSALSLVLNAGAALLLGLPVVLQIKMVLILWTFIYIINWKIYDRKECEQINA